MSVHSQDSDNEELGAIGGKKPISRQVSPFSRPSSVVFMESLAKTLTEQMQQQSERMQQQQQENMRQQQELMHNITSRMDTIKDQSDTTNSTLADLSRSHTELHRSQTDLNAKLERIERASPDLNPVELRTNPSDGNFAFHAVPPQVTAPLATRPSFTSDEDKETETSFRPLTSVSRSLLELNPPSVLRRSERIRNRIMMGGIQEEVSEVMSPLGRSSRVAEGPQLPRTDCLLSVPRKAKKTSDTVTFSPVARSREPGSQRKFPTFGDEDGIVIRETMELGSRNRVYGYNVSRRTDGRETIIYEEEFIFDEGRNRSRHMGRIVVDNMSGIDGIRRRNVPNLNLDRKS